PVLRVRPASLPGYAAGRAAGVDRPAHPLRAVPRHPPRGAARRAGGAGHVHHERLPRAAGPPHRTRHVLTKAPRRVTQRRAGPEVPSGPALSDGSVVRCHHVATGTGSASARVAAVGLTATSMLAMMRSASSAVGAAAITARM